MVQRLYRNRPFSLVTLQNAMPALNSQLYLSNVPGTTFNYIVKSATSNVSGYSNGTGNTINQYLTNNSATTGTVVYTVSAVGNGCSGFSDKDVTVMVHPSPSAVITPSSSTNICLGESVT